MKMRRAVEDYTPDSDDNNFKSELLHIAKGLKDLRTHRLGKRRREAAITSAADGWRDNNDMEQTLDDGKSMWYVFWRPLVSNVAQTSGSALLAELQW